MGRVRLLLGISIFWLALSMLVDGLNTLVVPHRLRELSGNARGAGDATLLGANRCAPLRRAAPWPASPAWSRSAPHPPAGSRHTPYTGYDIMAPDQWAHDWDPKTRRLVLDCISNVPARSFFSDAELALLEAVCRRFLPQDDHLACHHPQAKLPPDEASI